MSEAAFNLDEARPFSVTQLAARWECSEGLIRKLIRDRRLQCFYLGALIRISAAEVGRFECQSQLSIPSSDLGEGMPSSAGNGTKKRAGLRAGAGNSPRKIGRAPRRKLESSGNAATVHRGPWGE